MKDRDKKLPRGLRVHNSGCSWIPHAVWPFQQITEMLLCPPNQFFICLSNECPVSFFLLLLLCIVLQIFFGDWATLISSSILASPIHFIYFGNLVVTWKISVVPSTDLRGWAIGLRSPELEMATLYSMSLSPSWVTLILLNRSLSSQWLHPVLNRIIMDGNNEKNDTWGLFCGWRGK